MVGQLAVEALRQGPHSGPVIYLQDSEGLPVNHVGVTTASRSFASGDARPLSMTSGDIDEDGIADLVVGYSVPGGGAIVVHRGNLDAFAPQSQESFQAIGEGRFPSPFLLDARVFSIPITPDFVAVGNFTGADHPDLVVGSRGGNLLYVFPGDGKANFDVPQTLSLTGRVTALAAGDLGYAQQFTDLIVGVSDGQGSFLQVFRGGEQGLTARASYTLRAPVSSIAFGEFGDPGTDAAFLSGGKVRILRSSSMQLLTVPLPVSARAMALGSFIFDRNSGSQIALLTSDGGIQIAVRNEFDPRAYTVEEFSAIRQARLRNEAPPLVPVRSFPVNGWKIVESFPGVASVGAAHAPVFFRTRISSSAADDLMLLNASAGQLVVISHSDLQPGAPTFLPGQVSLRPYSGSPVTALPMRINVDGRPGVMALHQGEIAPSMLMPLPDPTFTVNRTDDPTPASPISNACNGVANDCSLREAVLKANATSGTDTIMVPAGTYTLTIAKMSGDYTGNFGALYINDSVNIVGAGQNTTIIQAGTTAYNAGVPNGVDMVMAVNQDITSFTNATASISNLTLQNGHNRGTVAATDGDGGGMEFDTGGTGNNNLTLTNVTIQNCDTTDGNGGGLASFNTKNGTGLVTITNSIIQGNSAKQVTGGVTGTGGGIWVADPSRMSLSNSHVLNNLATAHGTSSAGSGGGITTTSNTSNSRQTVIHGSTISGNLAAGLGGGINATTNLLIDQGSIISNNSGGTADITNLKDGGGIFMNPSKVGCPGACTDTVILAKVSITGNSAPNGRGGGIISGTTSGGGPLTMSFSRLAGNSAVTSGSNLENINSTVTSTNNWWGTNNPASTINTSVSATTTFAPFLALTHTASPSTILRGCTSTLTASFLIKSDSTTTAASNLDVLIGLPITFNNAVLGMISSPQSTIQSSGTATATFTAGATGGNGSADAKVDSATVTAPITINQPPAINCPANITKSTDANICTTTATYSPTATGFPAPTVTCVPASGSTFNKGTTTVTCTASNGIHTDATCVSAGTAADPTCMFTVTVNDTQAPVFSGCTNITTNTAAGLCTAVVTYAPTATDNCDGARPVTCVPASGSTFPKGVTTVTCTASDLNTPTVNTGTCMFTVTVNDNQAPVLSGCTNITTNTASGVCTAAPTFMPTATDNCDGSRPVTCVPASGSTFPKGVTTVTCTASDLNTPTVNTGTCMFTVTVSDNQGPQSCVTAPPNMISWWPGDGNGNDIQDGNNLSLGGATFAAGKVGQALSFNGSQFANAGTPANLTSVGSQITLDGWVNPAVTDANSHVYFGRSVSNGNDYLLLANFGILTGVIKTGVTETFLSTGVTLSINTWTHIALTYDGTTMTVYVNGVVAASQAKSGTIANSGASFDIGGRSGGLFFTGLIDEVEVFSRALMAAEIKSISDADSFGKCKPVTVSTDAGQCSAVVNYTKPTAVDNCDGARTVTCAPDTGTTFQKGITTVTCTSSDTSNNTTSSSFALTVKDTELPTLTCPSNISVIANACQVETYTTPTASDNCPGATVNCAPPSGTCFAIGMTTVTCTATDTSNNTAQCTFTVAVTPCTINCPSPITDNVAPGTCAKVETYSAPTTTGTCGTVTCSPASGSSFPKGVTTVTCSTTAGPSCMLTVTIHDNEAPVLSGCANVNANTASNACSAVVNYTQPTASDVCDGTRTVTCMPPAGSTFPKGVTTVNCSASDLSSNMGTCMFTVTVTDNVAPVFSGCTNLNANTASNSCDAVVNYTTPTATDNCDGTRPVTCIPATGSTFSKGVTTVTCSASDANTPTVNTATCMFTVTVADNVAPVLSGCTNLNANSASNTCNAVVSYTQPTANDNCDGSRTVTCNPASGATFNKGVTTVSCSATDTSSNTGTCAFTVTVADTVAPVLSGCTNVSANTVSNACTAVVTYTQPTANDNCDGTRTVTCNPASGSTFNKGVTTVSCSASDTSNNTGNCTFTVTVTDTTAPVLSGCTNVSANTASNACTVVVTYTQPTANDNCDGARTVTCNPASGSTFIKGVTTVSCSATDTSNNTGNCTFTVTVTDTTAPVITCPSNVTHGTDQGVCTAVVTYPNATATDNCSGVGTPVCVPASGSTFSKGTTTVNCSVSDASNNPASCSFTVKVNDTQNPTVTCPSNINFTTPGFNDLCGIVTYATPGGSDNCAVQSVVCSPASGTCFPVGMTTVTCTAKDTSNNMGSCTFKVIVSNPCTITCPANITKNNDPNQCGAVVTFAPTTTGGGCGTVTCAPASGSFFAKGTTTVMCTTSGPSCSFTVTVNDTQPPVFPNACPGINVAAPATCPFNSSTGVTYATPAATDNCPGVTVACDPPSGATFPVGTTTVTCTATDASNNATQCTFPVTVASLCVQDDSNPGNVVLVNVNTGGYRFCCNGVLVATGTGTVTARGCIVTISENAGTRRVQISIDGSANKGSATIRVGSTILCSFTDRKLTNNTCVCQ
jgi:large repetitive protein